MCWAPKVMTVRPHLEPRLGDVAALDLVDGDHIDVDGAFIEPGAAWLYACAHISIKPERTVTLGETKPSPDY